MPSKPRSEIINPDEEGVYHVYNQIVDQRFLLGYDQISNTDFGYRRDWLRDILKRLAQYFAIDVLDYAILDNHLHLMVRNRPEIVSALSDEEVVRRWLHICPVSRDRKGNPRPPTPRTIRSRLFLADKYRERLSSISWLMRLLCQRIAIRANKEDNRRGPFFAGRFGSDRMESEEAILACSLYIGLNVIRAGAANTPEESQFTSARDRIRAGWHETLQDLEQEDRIPNPEDADAWLAPIFCDTRAHAIAGPVEFPSPSSGNGDSNNAIQEQRQDAENAPSSTRRSYNVNRLNPFGAPRVSNKGFLPLTTKKYLELLDLVGRIARPDKQGVIPRELPPILERLRLSTNSLLKQFAELDRSLPPDRIEHEAKVA